MIESFKNLPEERNTVFNETKTSDFNPDERYNVEKAGHEIESRDFFNPDERMKPEIEPDEDGFYTSKAERINHCPIEDGPRGEWTGDRGDSIFIPTNYLIKEYLQRHGVEGIKYSNGEADFSPVSKATVEIDNMTLDRYSSGGNFEQFDAKLAEQFNRECKDGRTDWTARDVADYIKENGFVRHERCDCKTMDLLDYKVHRYFTHSGGCNECKHRDGYNIGGGFDA